MTKATTVVSSPATSPAHTAVGWQFRFLRQYLQNPKQVGSVAPSSRALALAMVADLPVDKARLAVEYGPGTGALTGVVLAALPPESRLVVVEPNPVFQRHLAQHFPGVGVIPDQASNVTQYLGADVGNVDLVFSGLPCSLMSLSRLVATVRATDQILRPGGHFRSFLYHHTYWLPKLTVLRRLLGKHFRHVDTRPVWANLPPAIVLRCVK